MYERVGLQLRAEETRLLKNSRAHAKRVEKLSETIRDLTELYHSLKEMLWLGLF